jgi:hypothetical protein
MNSGGHYRVNKDGKKELVSRTKPAPLKKPQAVDLPATAAEKPVAKKPKDPAEKSK